MVCWKGWWRVLGMLRDFCYFREVIGGWFAVGAFPLPERIIELFALYGPRIKRPCGKH